MRLRHMTHAFACPHPYLHSMELGLAEISQHMSIWVRNLRERGIPLDDNLENKAHSAARAAYVRGAGFEESVSAGLRILKRAVLSPLEVTHN